MNSMNRIKELRQKSGLTMQQLSDKTKIGKSTIASYESRGVNPKMENAKKLADFFGVEPAYILGLSDIEKVPTISDRLKELRKEKGVTLKEMAVKIGLNISTISNYENGYSIPKIYNLKLLSDFFGVNESYILGYSDKKYYDVETADNALNDVRDMLGVDIYEIVVFLSALNSPDDLNIIKELSKKMLELQEYKSKVL